MTFLQSVPPRHRHAAAPMRIALLASPAADDDQVAREVGRRLVQQGHAVTAYARAPREREHLGVRVVAVPSTAAAALSAVHAAGARRHDVAFVFGASSAPLVPALRARGTAVAVHLGDVPPTRWSRAAERLAVREADAVVVGTRGRRDRVEDGYGVAAELIGTGARIVRHVPADLLEGLGLVPRQFHLAAGPAVPADVVEGYRRSAATLPLLVVADSAADAARLRSAARGDDRVRVLDGAADERLLDQLHAHARCAVHGGTAASGLLRSMGAGTAVLARDAALTREIAGTAGSYFADAPQLATLVEEAERYPFRFRDIGELMQERARTRHDWDAVTECYEALAARLARGFSTRGTARG